MLPFNIYDLPNGYEHLFVHMKDKHIYFITAEQLNNKVYLIATNENGDINNHMLLSSNSSMLLENEVIYTKVNTSSNGCVTINGIMQNKDTELWSKFSIESGCFNLSSEVIGKIRPAEDWMKYIEAAEYKVHAWTQRKNYFYFVGSDVQSECNLPVLAKVSMVNNLIESVLTFDKYPGDTKLVSLSVLDNRCIVVGKTIDTVTEPVAITVVGRW